MPHAEITALQRTIHDLHGCESQWVASVPVKEVFQGRTVWEGVVEVFDLIGYPTAKRCYAWSHAVEGSKKRRYVAVLHQGPVDSPEKAVRAAIVQENRSAGMAGWVPCKDCQKRLQQAKEKVSKQTHKSSLQVVKDGGRKHTSMGWTQDTTYRCASCELKWVRNESELGALREYESEFFPEPTDEQRPLLSN